MKGEEDLSGKGKSMGKDPLAEWYISWQGNVKKVNVCGAKSQGSVVSEEVAEEGKPHLCRFYRPW